MSEPLVYTYERPDPDIRYPPNYSGERIMQRREVEIDPRTHTFNLAGGRWVAAEVLDEFLYQSGGWRPVFSSAQGEQ